MAPDRAGGVVADGRQEGVIFGNGASRAVPNPSRVYKVFYRREKGFLFSIRRQSSKFFKDLSLKNLLKWVMINPLKTAHCQRSRRHDYDFGGLPSAVRGAEKRSNYFHYPAQVKRHH